MKDTFIFKQDLYARVETEMNKNSTQVQRMIMQYIDKNNEALFAQGPSKRMFFLDTDRDNLYKYIGIGPEDVKASIKKCNLIDSSWKILNEPFNLSCVMVIRYYQIKKKQKELESAVMYLALSFYAHMQRKYFPFEPNENIMSYTINNLSNKYKIKQLGNLFKAIHSTAMNNHEHFEKEIDHASDLMLKNYIMSLKTRLDGMIQNIANEFYENHDKGNYLNTEEDSYEEGNFYLTDSNSATITRITENTTSRILTKGVDMKIVDLSANICGVGKTALRNAILSIIDKKDKEIKHLILLILQLYLMDGKQTPEMIKSKHFINFCLEVYIKSNTNDETIIKIKDILDQWLTECSVNYLKTERVATKNNFRKATMLYFVFEIQKGYGA